VPHTPAANLFAFVVWCLVANLVVASSKSYFMTSETKTRSILILQGCLDCRRGRFDHNPQAVFESRISSSMIDEPIFKHAPKVIKVIRRPLHFAVTYERLAINFATLRYIV
jgi:hypothetical protein